MKDVIKEAIRPMADEMGAEGVDLEELVDELNGECLEGATSAAGDIPPKLHQCMGREPLFGSPEAEVSLVNQRSTAHQGRC